MIEGCTRGEEDRVKRTGTLVKVLAGTAVGIAFAWWATERITRQRGGGCCSGGNSSE